MSLITSKCRNGLPPALDFLGSGLSTAMGVILSLLLVCMAAGAASGGGLLGSDEAGFASGPGAAGFSSFGGGVGAAVASTGAGGGGSLLGAGCLCCPTASPASFVPGPLVGAVLPAAAGGGGGASGDELPQPISKISIWLAEECRLPVAKYTRVPECNHSLSVYNVSVRIRKWRFFRSILVAGRRSPALSWLHATPANAATPKPPGWVSSDRLDCI
mmetsp:Transcript_39224/g.111043  ORF Transcript_39224/g.111043 Transcript_39224/m.111043 type:complete len:216 (-) Transcript_39224:514-1161(-)